MEKDKELYRRIDEVVHYIWDPIGVSDAPSARDEYYSYLPEIYARVIKGNTSEIVEYLNWVVSERMGMIFNREKAIEAAEIMLEWKEIFENRT